MLLKWKFILTNWINCYFNESSKPEQCVNVESLLTIISHLRENLNLNESKSSTLEEFIREKYPEFKFENGTIEATNEEQIHIVASLLLFFVCVNSKDVDIKTAMCCKLSPEDQETILKFSKCLMVNSSVTFRDVQTAITEACGQEVVAVESATKYVKMAETPPVLRSLHGEVRRLQAALDAERFDRNYLQEELIRTNLQLEKLLKDKEQYNQDIVNLKAKISMCCGQEAEVRGGDAAAETSARLTRQLQELEERLLATRDRLDDTQHERDTYKAKIGELKQERDKWVSVSQQEASRADQLADELDTERRHVDTLKGLVTELRQHHQSNCLDTNEMENDDPDDIHDNNASTCNEVCANVVEIQLGEERAQTVILKQQIEALQDQLNDLNKVAESETQSLKIKISERDKEILGLKHHINAEIEEKNKLKAHFNDEFSKLNNEINELEQKLKDNTDSSKVVIEQKMHDIQIIQEDKLSLLQSLERETTKLETTVKDLRKELDTEINLKLKMKEDYEHRLMKLNEKVLIRNNELVELQNNIFEKNEINQQLHLELRTERGLKDELLNKYHSDLAQLNQEKNCIEINLQQKTNESKELQRRLLQNVAVFEEFNREIDDLKIYNSDLLEKCRISEETKASLHSELRNRDSKVDKIQKDMENIKNIFSEEKNNFNHILDERNATISSLQMQLHSEIHYKTELLNDIANIQQAKANLCEEVKMLNTELTQVKKDIHEKDRMIYAIDLYLKEERHTNKILKQECDNRDEELERMTLEIADKDEEIKVVQEKVNELKEKYYSDLKEKQEELDTRHTELKHLQTNIKIHEDYCVQLSSVLSSGLDKLFHDIKIEDVCNEGLQNLITTEKSDEMSINEKCDLLISIAHNLTVELFSRKHLEITLEKEHTALNETRGMFKQKETQILELQLEVKQLQQMLSDSKVEQSKLAEIHSTSLESKEIEIQKLQMETQSLNNELNDIKVKLDVKVYSLKEKIIDNKTLTDKLKKTYESQIENLNIMLNKLTSYLKSKTVELDSLRMENERLLQAADHDTKVIQSLEDDAKFQKQNQEKFITDFESERLVLKNMVTVTESVMEDQKMTLNKVINEYSKDNEALHEEIKGLKSQLEAERKNSEMTLQDKDSKCATAFKEVSVLRAEKENLLQDMAAQQESSNKNINALKSELNTKISNIETLELRNKDLTVSMQKYKNVIQSLEDEVKCEKHNQEKLITDFETKRLVLQNMVTVTESVMEDQKISLNRVMNEYLKANEKLQEEIKDLKVEIDSERKNTEIILQDKKKLLTDMDAQKGYCDKEIITLKSELKNIMSIIETLELQNENLTTAVEKYENVIQSLEDEVKCHKQHQEKLITDFKSERLVLKNTASVTESVLEDQKMALNKVINNYVNENEMLQEEIKDLKVKLDAERKNVEVILQEKDFTVANIFKEVSVLRDDNEKLVKDMKVQKETSDKEVTTLKSELKNNISNIETLESRNKNLSNAMEKYQGVIQSLEDQVKCSKQNQEKIIGDFESERVVLKNMVTATESAMEDQKINLNKVINEYLKDNEMLLEEIKNLTVKIDTERNNTDIIRQDNENLLRDIENQKENSDKEITTLKLELKNIISIVETLELQNKDLTNAVQKYKSVTQSLEHELKCHKENQEKIKTDFESERLVLKNKITIAETGMDDQKMVLNKVINGYLKENDTLREEIKDLKSKLEAERKNSEVILQEKDTTFAAAFKQISILRDDNEKILKDMDTQKEHSEKEITTLKSELKNIMFSIETLELQNKDLTSSVQKYKHDIAALEEKDNELKIKKDSLEFELVTEIDKLTTILKGEIGKNDKLQSSLQEKLQTKMEIQDKVRVLSNEIIDLVKMNSNLEREKNEKSSKLSEFIAASEKATLNAREELDKLRNDNAHLGDLIQENNKVISKLEQLIKHESEQNQKLRENIASEKLNLNNKCSLLEEYQMKADKLIKERDEEISKLKENIDSIKCNLGKYWNSVIDKYQINVDRLQAEVDILNTKLKSYDQDLRERDDMMTKTVKEKDAVINTINNELIEERVTRETYQRELEQKSSTVCELRQKLEEAKRKANGYELMRKENNEVKKVGHPEAFVVCCQTKLPNLEYSESTSDLTYYSTEVLKPGSNVDKIIYHKKRTITTLLSNIHYLKTLIIDESEDIFLDILKDVEVYISNRPSEIIKVSAKHQGIIMKRIAEIKPNIILKDLTNFGNTPNCAANDLKRSRNSGSVTMKDLEFFLETTDRHLKQCTEKQFALQTERDKLTEVNRIKESEIVKAKKFLTELSMTFNTFSSVKELYSKKLNKVVSVQGTVRREILNLDGHVTDATMCKLERGYAAVMRDLSECAMNLETWVERCVDKIISPEKIKQAFTTSDDDTTSLIASGFQNTCLEIQLEEYENSFKKLLEEVAHVQLVEEAKDESVTMQVRAEYEDKLNRMKAKMKELYREQIVVFTKSHRQKVDRLELELQKAQDKLRESKQAYEEHIRSLTTELWSVTEKFLMKKDEAEWLRKKRRSGSLMSLQHMHSSGLAPMPEAPTRQSDSHSLRSLPVHAHRDTKDERPGLRVPDEAYAAEELRPAQLECSCPADTQLTPALDECAGAVNTTAAGKQQRKEVGITAYKKPGLPTPSKQAGRLSATDSELSEMLHLEPDALRKASTSTPSRFRSLFRSSRSDNAHGTPRSKRLSNIFRKK